MKKIFFVLFLIFSLLIINGKYYSCEVKDSLFSKIERYILDKYEFVESGMKLEYTVKSDIDDEYSRIEKTLNKKEYQLIYTDKNRLSIKYKKINYSINVYNYEDLTKVEVIAINNDPDISTFELKSLLQEIRNDNFIDERYFSFIKGKISEKDKNVFDNIEKDLQLQINDRLEINNGYIAKAKMKDESYINIGQINYDTGSYLIIGTPIIFVTY